MDVDSFNKVCVDDICYTENNTNAFLCETISEFSRQCVHAGGKPQQWRNETFCCKRSFECSGPEIQASVTALFASCFAELFDCQQYSNIKSVCLHRPGLSVQHGVLGVQQFLSWQLLQPLRQPDMRLPLPWWLQLPCRYPHTFLQNSHEITSEHSLNYVWCTNIEHNNDEEYLSSPPQEWSLMTSVTLAVLQWINVHVCTTTKSTILESPTLTAVDPGKMRTWVKGTSGIPSLDCCHCNGWMDGWMDDLWPSENLLVGFFVWFLFGLFLQTLFVLFHSKLQLHALPSPALE